MQSQTKKSASSATLVVFERDLRLTDHEALAAAAELGPVLPLFVLDSPLEAELGGAQKWWLHHSLAALDAAFAEYGGRLALLRANDRAEAIVAFARQHQIGRVFWTARHGVSGRDQDAVLAEKLRDAGLGPQVFAGQLLHRPDTVRTSTGGFFKVYTPFWRATSADIAHAPPLPAPESLECVTPLESDMLASFNLLPTRPDWSGGLADEWTPGEAGAHDRLLGFLDRALFGYGEGRNRPDLASTSKLSPHLAFGEISPRQIVATASKHRASRNNADLEVFFKEIVWREFAYHLLVNTRQTPRDIASANFNAAFDTFPWVDAETVGGAHFKAWTKGQTGYPIVDAGMRQLWQTGWMHNRVRMIVASFLCKHLLIDWRRGERWFWDTLVDADPASNAASWQWVAGSGADAAPYFRIFNPVLQGEKFDPDGNYVRRFVPELAKLPEKFIHKPWEAPLATLSAAGVRLGKTYPHPIIDHATGRGRALAAYQSMRDA
jgi:deoxyribodipyrimidine photo-lyase